MREERAARAVEGLLWAALVASLVVALVTRGSPAYTEAPGPPWTSIPIDVARDPPWMLRLLPGIGPARAQAIVADRERAGPVASVGDLNRVKGLGPRVVSALEAAGAVVRERERPP